MSTIVKPTIATATRPDTSDAAATRFLHELVATPSVSPNEAAAAKCFVRTARALGLEATIDEVGNGVACARARTKAQRCIALLGHIDTVPGEIPVRIENNILHGRGSVDAKGPLATMLFAAARAQRSETTDVYVIAALGEETSDSPGAHHIASVLKPEACIIGEPSGWDGVTIGYKGRLTVRARVRCDWAHSAGPELTAPDELMVWWHRVLEFMAETNSKTTSIFDQLQASILAWQSSNDGIDDRATMTANFRLPLSLTPADMERALSLRAQECVSLEFVGSEQAYATGRDDLVVTALSNAIRSEGASPRHKRKTGTADFNVVAPVWQCPIAAYGPGDSSLDHTPNEHVHIEEYCRAIRVVTTAIETLTEA